jgi:CubicO group peptidase (beta-lactamase class C family)
LTAARQVLLDAAAAGTFPAATVDVGSSTGPLWQDAIATSLSTPFDLASLTKPIVTASVVMRLLGDRRITLDDRVGSSFKEWLGPDRESVTIRDLLEHSSGLAARLVEPPPSTRREFEHEICRMRLEYQPRTQSIYSDLGFLLLGFLAADRGQAPIDTQFESIVAGISPALVFAPPPEVRAHAAPTTALAEDLRRGQTLTGVVHDNYAAALGGIAGHAGLFGSADAVGAFARAVLRAARGDELVPYPFTPALVRQFVTRSRVPGSSRALAWDTMLVTSSCGTRMSPSAFGHVGYTGTSLWIDPDRDRYFVLLTNRARVGGSPEEIERSLEEMRTVRRAFHDALAIL